MYTQIETIELEKLKAELHDVKAQSLANSIRFMEGRMIEADLRDQLTEVTAHYYEVCGIADNIQEEMDEVHATLREILGEEI